PGRAPLFRPGPFPHRRTGTFPSPLLSTAVLFLLATPAFVFRRRARSLEKKYQRVAAESDKLARSPLLKEGNSCRPDPYQTAKRQLQLGLLVQRRDRLEGRMWRWRRRGDRARRWLARARPWHGRKPPYTSGALDVAGALALADYLCVGDFVSLRNVVQLVTSLFSNG